jgi:hypothetical protein
MSPTEDEFAEFDTDEATFDAMMAAAEPAELTHGPLEATVTIQQSDDVVFTLKVPSSGFLWAGAATRAFHGDVVVPGELKSPAVHHPSSSGEAALAG